MFALAVMRSVVWSERLAVIELVVVYVVARLAFARVTTLRWWRIGTIVPLVAPLLLYVAFTGTEYIRTWDYYRNEYDSVWAFAFERLLTYYATASNNGIGLLVENNNWPVFSGRFVAEWLYLMPEVGDWMRESLGDPMTYYTTFLDRFARPEFNSATGLFQVVFDLGYAGSMLYFLAVGALIGRLWDGWRRQSPAQRVVLSGRRDVPGRIAALQLLRRHPLLSTGDGAVVACGWSRAGCRLQPHHRTAPW